MAVAAGCATRVPLLYSWGGYEELVYATYAAPGALPPIAQVDALEKDLQVARAKNLHMPPGWHAHLGYLYFQLGNIEQARHEFGVEKTEFPESTIFMDRLISKLKTS